MSLHCRFGCCKSASGLVPLCILLFSILCFQSATASDRADSIDVDEFVETMSYELVIDTTGPEPTVETMVDSTTDSLLLAPLGQVWRVPGTSFWALTLPVRRIPELAAIKGVQFRYSRRAYIPEHRWNDNQPALGVLRLILTSSDGDTSWKCRVSYVIVPSREEGVSWRLDDRWIHSVVVGFPEGTAWVFQSDMGSGEYDLRIMVDSSAVLHCQNDTAHTLALTRTLILHSIRIASPANLQVKIPISRLRSNNSQQELLTDSCEQEWKEK